MITKKKATDDKAWRVRLKSDAVIVVKVTSTAGRACAIWRNGNFRVKEASAATPRRAVLALAVAMSWDVVEVIAPGAVTRTLALVEKECARLQEIIAGRETAPTNEEIDRHARNDGGRWLIRLPRTNDPEIVYLGSSTDRPYLQRPGTVLLWIPLDANRRPCAWPSSPRKAVSTTLRSARRTKTT